MPADSAPGLPSSFRRDKLALAQVLARTRWHAAARAAERRLGLIRVFNTHSTPARYADSFGRQLDLLLDRYEARDPYRLEETLERGAPEGRPVAFFTFDDGFRNHHEVAAPELEKRGARGIFSIPSDFPSVPAASQVEWCRRRIRWESDGAEHADDDDLRPMSWDQARELVARGHRICSHTRTHEILTSKTSRETMEAEVVDSRRRLEDELGATVDGFCWPVEYDPAATAVDDLIRATYSYALLSDTRPIRKGHDPFRVHRTRFEASWPIAAVELQVSGMIDGAFALRRARTAVGR